MTSEDPHRPRRLYFLLQVASARIQKRADRDLRDAIDLSATQLGALFYISRHEGCLLKDLSAGLRINNSATTTLVNRMVTRGLITRHRSSDDGRAFEVYTTEEGRERASAARPLLASLNATLEATFGEEELDVIERFLTHVITRSLEPTPPHEEP